VSRDNPRVLYVQYTNPAAYPPLEHSSQLLAHDGWTVSMLGTGLSDTLVLPHHPRVHVELMPFVGAGLRQKLHYARFAALAALRARQQGVDWIYASDPAASPAALAAAAASGARVVYHEHDAPDETPGAQSSFGRAILRARQVLAARAEMCVVPSGGRADAFRAAHPRARVVTVWNCPTRREIADLKPARDPARFRVLYHGSIVPARLPATVIEAMSQLPSNASLVVAGYETAGHHGYVESLRRRASELGIGDRVEFVGTIPKREDLLRQCATCDVGLALMPNHSSDFNERTMAGASNKAFDYMACGLSVVTSDLASWREIFVEPGFAVSCDPDSATSLAAALRRLHDEAGLREAMGTRARKKILDEWHYEAAFEPVRAHMSAAVSRQIPAPLAVPSSTERSRS
jgi:glycosyltransferase involved in cell wall biosynthesis